MPEAATKPHDLTDLKPGDEVCVRSSGDYSRIHTVARLTPTQIVLDNGTKYYRANGREVGFYGHWFFLSEDSFTLARQQAAERADRADTAKKNQQEQEMLVARHREARERIMRYIQMRKEKPMNQLGDAVPTIHSGTEWEAELRLSDLEILLNIAEFT